MRCQIWILECVGIALTVTLLAWLSAPTDADAQAGYYVTPSFSVAEVYDDNVFYTSSNRVTDFITRFSPGIQAGYQSDPLTLLGRYTFDAEVYAKNPDLTTALARQAASLDFRYVPARGTTLSLGGGYVETHTPSELNVTTGVQTARGRAQQASANPSFRYEFDPLTAATVGYTFTWSNEAGGTTTDSHRMALGVDRRISPRDTLTFAYDFEFLSFSNDGTDTVNTFTLGWTSELTPRTTIALRAGARLENGSVKPTGSASIEHRLESWRFSLAYSNGLNTITGETGTVITNAVNAAITYQPLRALQLGATAGFFLNTQDSSETKVFQVGANATYQILEWLSLVGSYQYTFQRGILGATTGTDGNGNIPHNVLLLKLVVTYPYRVY